MFFFINTVIARAIIDIYDTVCVISAATTPAFLVFCVCCVSRAADAARAAIESPLLDFPVSAAKVCNRNLSYPYCNRLLQ